MNKIILKYQLKLFLNQIKIWSPIKSFFDHMKFIKFLYLRRPKLNKLGFKIVGPPEMETGEYETYLTSYINATLSTNESFLNIDANFGYYGLLARFIGCQKVILVEPDSQNLRILRKNLIINGFSDAVVINTACSEMSGSTKLFGHGTGASLISNWEGNISGDSQIVDVVTIDQIMHIHSLETPITILIDVEGMEFECLSGAQETLKDLKNAKWIIELSLFRNDFESKEMSSSAVKVIDLMKKNGFQSRCWLGANQSLV